MRKNGEAKLGFGLEMEWDMVLCIALFSEASTCVFLYVLYPSLACLYSQPVAPGMIDGCVFILSFYLSR